MWSRSVVSYEVEHCIGACDIMQYNRLLTMSFLVFCLDILSEDKDASDSLLKNIFSFNFVLGIMVPNSVLISIVYLHLLSTAVPAAAAHLPRAQPVTSQCGAGTHWVAGSVPPWLPFGCFVKNIGSTWRTWLQFLRRWWRGMFYSSAPAPAPDCPAPRV